MCPFSDIPTIELCENFIFIHFPEHQVIDTSALETLVHDVMDYDSAHRGLLFDMRAVDGFSVEAFELLTELVNTCEEHVAVLTRPNEIGAKYAHLLALSDDKDHTRTFLSFEAARKWICS